MRKHQDGLAGRMFKPSAGFGKRGLSAACVTAHCCIYAAATPDEELTPVVPVAGRAPWAWRLRPAVMGILNVTPDSFSDGGAYGSVRTLL